MRAPAYEYALDSGHDHVAPEAAINLTVLLKEQADSVAHVPRTTVRRGTRSWRPRAAYGLGRLLEELGDLTGAVAAYAPASESDDLDLVTCAAGDLGALLAARGDATGARAAFERALISNPRSARINARTGMEF